MKENSLRYLSRYHIMWVKVSKQYQIYVKIKGDYIYMSWCIQAIRFPGIVSIMKLPPLLSTDFPIQQQSATKTLIVL